ncbi:MAG: YeeE/YedE family protein, partial [Rhodospirillales bacterium]|nr:YeeE/YedE family protein [Rhodospirillales bacterium]
MATQLAAGLGQPASAPPEQGGVLALGLALFAAGALVLVMRDPAMALLFLIGGLMGVTLYHAAFGFTAAYRRLFVERDVTGVRAQLIMVAIATLLFAPVLAAGSAFGREVVGAVSPVGWQVAIGAFMFGVGMQLGGGCGSGTLFTLGGGSARMIVTFIAFVAGSFWASLHMVWWQGLPSLGEISLGESLGWPAGVALQLGFLAVLAYALKLWSKAAPVRARPAPEEGWRRWLRGPWPLLAGAVALAVLNFVTLLAAGHPWSITWAFTLWGAKTAQLFGWIPAAGSF